MEMGNAMVLGNVLEFLGPEASPSRAIKALRSGRASQADIDNWLRNGSGDWKGWLPEWRRTVSSWQAGNLFKGQRVGWEAWCCELYSKLDRWLDRKTYEEKVWVPAFCSGEDKSEAFEQIHAFYISRVDNRYHGITPEFLAKLDEKGMAQIKRVWYAEQTERNWGCWGSV